MLPTHCTSSHGVTLSTITSPSMFTCLSCSLRVSERNPCVRGCLGTLRCDDLKTDSWRARCYLRRCLSTAGQVVWRPWPASGATASPPLPHHKTNIPTTTPRLCTRRKYRITLVITSPSGIIPYSWRRKKIITLRRNKNAVCGVKNIANAKHI